MKPLRALVVDDEPLAREMVRELLRQDPEIEVIGESGDGRQALDQIRQWNPDVVFLDIEMPEQSGLDVAASLAKDASPQELPAIIFLTAYSSHAIEAFELEALDYVVKPFSDQRFFATLERAKKRVRQQRLGALASQIAALSQGFEQDSETVPEKRPKNPTESRPPEADFLRRVPVSQNGRTKFIPVEQVIWIESCDYYSRVHTQAGSHLVRTSLAWFEERLDPSHFLRIHRGAIVHQEQVVEMKSLFKGHRELVLRDGTRLKISRSRRRLVEQALARR